MLDAKTTVSQRVRKVAGVISLFTIEELAQLVSLVPQIREVQPTPESEEAASAAEYYRRKLLTMRGGKPPAMDEIFIGGLTYTEYLALSEEEEAVFWDKLFAEEEIEIDNFEEHDVKPGAYIPARQERGAKDHRKYGQDRSR